MKTKCLLILSIFLLVSPCFSLEIDQQEVGKTNFEVSAGFSGSSVYYMATRYTYRASAKTEIGWGLNYYKLDDTEQSLHGNYLTFGPVFKHNSRLVKGFGLLFSLDLLASIYSNFTSTPAETDKSAFRVEITPELLFYQQIKFGKNLSMFPAAGVCTTISYYEFEEKKKEGQEGASGYTRGIIETRVVVRVPLLIHVSKHKYIVVEPAYKHHIYSSKFEKMETFTVKMRFSW
jgi:hypothetical protein